MKRVIALVGVFTVASVLLFADSKNNSRIYTPGPGIIKLENNVLTATPTEATIALGSFITYNVYVPSDCKWSTRVTIGETDDTTTNGVTVSPENGTGPAQIQITANQPGTYTVTFTLDNLSNIQNNPVKITVSVLE